MSRTRLYGSTNGTPFQRSTMTFDDDADAEREPARRGRRPATPRDCAMQRRRPGEGGHDRGAEAQPRLPRRREGQRRERVGAVGLGGPHVGVAEVGQLHELVARGRAAGRQRHRHSGADRQRHGAGRYSDRRARLASSNWSRNVAPSVSRRTRAPGAAVRARDATSRPRARTTRCRRANRARSRPRRAIAPAATAGPRVRTPRPIGLLLPDQVPWPRLPRRTRTTSRQRCPRLCSRGRATTSRRRRSPGCRRATPARCEPTNRCGPRRARSDRSHAPRARPSPSRRSTPRPPRLPRSRTAGCAARGTGSRRASPWDASPAARPPTAAAPPRP